MNTKKQTTQKTSTQKPKVVQEKEPTYSVSNCVINNSSAANENTRAAVEALAKASEAHANALAKIADALKGSNATMESGIRIGG